MCEAVLFGLLLFMTTAGRGQTAHKVADSVEDKVCDRLMQLPEVKKMQRDIDSATHHKHGVAMLTEERPAKGHPYYTIAVGFDGPDRFVAYDTFYVWPDKMVVKVDSREYGKMLSLKQWRKMGAP